MRKLLILPLLLLAASVYAAEITIIPGDTLHLNATNPGKAYADLVAHSILVTTGPAESFDVRELRLDLIRDEQIVLSKLLSPERLVADTRDVAEMVGRGMSVLLDAQLLTRDGIDGITRRKMHFASGTRLGPNEALLLTRQHFSLDFVPDTLRASVQGRRKSGLLEMVSASVPISTYQSPVKYSTPLRGDWLMTSLPSIQSHHRLNPPTEFAVDFFKVNDEGRIFEGDVMKAASYFGHGAEVLAAAEGEVVFVIADEVQDRAAYLPRPGESLQQAGARIRFHSMRRYAVDFPRAAAGNIITLRHVVDGVTEYSSYGHLKAGSVMVEVGDRVRRGEVIGEVGDTGDSASVHLHFQINAGENPFLSRSLPVVFTDLKPNLIGVDPGRFVSTSGAQNYGAGGT